MTTTLEPAGRSGSRSPEPWVGRPELVEPLTGMPRAALSALVTLAFVGIILLRPGLPNNLAYVDIVLGVLAIVGVWSMTKVGSPATLAARRLLPWFWLFLVASFLGLANVGFTFWAAASLLSTTVALLSFFCVWHLIDLYGLERAATVGLVLATVLAMVALVLDPRAYRPEGWFIHPNYAGHFGVAAGLILFLAYRPLSLRVLGVISILFTIQVTGSFGAVGMFLAMGAVVGWRTLKRNTAVLAVALAVIVIGAGLVLAAPEPDLPNGAERAVEDAEQPLNPARFDRSQNTRFHIWGQALEVWAENPWGIGPNGVKNRDAAEQRGRSIEVHSDPIGVLVDRGPLGVLAFVGMWISIWLATKPYGLARILIIGNWVQGLFRETLHYRHMWMLLALLMVLDSRPADPRSGVRATPIGTGRPTH